MNEIEICEYIYKRGELLAFHGTSDFELALDLEQKSILRCIGYGLRGGQVTAKFVAGTKWIARPKRVEGEA